MTYLSHIRLGFNLVMLAVFYWCSDALVTGLKQGAAIIRTKTKAFAYSKYYVLLGLACTFGALMVWVDLPLLLTVHLMFQHFMQSSLTAIFPLWSCMNILDSFIEVCEDEGDNNRSLFKLITPFILTFMTDKILDSVIGEVIDLKTQQFNAERTKGFFKLLENINALPQYIFTCNTSALTNMWNTITKIHSPTA